MDDLELEIQEQRIILTQELSKEFQIKQQKLQEDLTQSWHAAEDKIQQIIGDEFVTLSQKVLTEWSNQTLADQLLLVFEKKLLRLSSARKKLLQKMLSQQKSLQIRVAPALHKKQQDVLKKILQKHFILPKNTHFQYRHNKDLILGIEIRIGDFSLDWNLNTYLKEINQNLKHNISSLIIPAQRKANK